MLSQPETGESGLHNRVLNPFAHCSLVTRASLAMAVASAFVLSFLFFLQLALHTRAAALTTAISANERLCFYADVDKAGEKIGVRDPPTSCRYSGLTSGL